MDISELKGKTTECEFVEVLEEPCHVPIIRNAYANIFIAKLARNNATLFHRHKENTVYVVISGSHCRIQIPRSEAMPQAYITGECLMGEHRIKPLIHRVECLNESPSDAWFVGTEILQNRPLPSEAILFHNRYEPILNVNIPECRAYRLQLSPNDSTGMHVINFSGVFISLGNTQLVIHVEKSDKQFPVPSGFVELGYVAWFNGPYQLEIKNVGSLSYEAIIIALA